MAKELERSNIPTALMTALPAIPLAVGTSRVVRGVRVEHVCGDPRLSEPVDMDLRKRIVQAALKALQTSVSSPSLFEPAEASEERR